MAIKYQRMLFCMIYKVWDNGRLGMADKHCRLKYQKIMHILYKRNATLGRNEQ